MLPRWHTFQATRGSHFLPPLSKEKSQGLGESDSALLFYSPLQVFTVLLVQLLFDYFFKPLSFFTSVSEMIWPH